MDGVPGPSQQPVIPGETFTYEFTPPDAGTFWYHPHINSIEQLGRGLVGGMIIDEIEPPAFDRDELLLIRNWQLNNDGSFGPLSIKRYAARQGTPGQTFTVNGNINAEFEIPAGASTRLRLLNADNTWHYEVSLEGVDAHLLALDAHPIAPIPFQSWLLGPGMRADLGVIAPLTPGKTFVLKHRHQVLARFNVTAPQGPARQTLPTLPANPVAEPDIARAEPYFFSFEWDAATDEQGRALFWNIKGPKAQRPAFCTNANLLATLERDKSYVFSLRNNTQYPHPIHLHGHAFKVLDSNKRTLMPHFADTVVLQDHEQIRIAFVADNPGAWMFHCHVIEHMAQGLAGMLAVV
jgi:FtsP/CotA-like multicopper oxidase with cupredoxin domain